MRLLGATLMLIGLRLLFRTKATYALTFAKWQLRLIWPEVRTMDIQLQLDGGASTSLSLRPKSATSAQDAERQPDLQDDSIVRIPTTTRRATLESLTTQEVSAKS